MIIDTDKMVTITQANKNFSSVAKLVEKKGEVTVFKNNKPKYKIIDLDTSSDLQLSEDEKIEIVSKRILNKYLYAWKELAK